jgi:putative membrane protein
MRRLVLGGVLAIALPAAVFAQPAAPSAVDYITIAGQSDLFEIQSGQLAEAKSANPAIKKFGHQMVTDHTNSTKMVMAAAKADGIPESPPPSLTADQKSMMAELKSESGEAFDKTYVAQQLKAHQDALAVQSSYAGSGDDPKLKSAANHIVPVVQMHITMLQGMS